MPNVLILRVSVKFIMLSVVMMNVFMLIVKAPFKSPMTKD